MRAKKYGALHCLRDTVARRHLFFNQRKGLSLDEILEFHLGKIVGKWWEVHQIVIPENAWCIERKLVLTTPMYAAAWEMVRDQEWERK